MPLRPDDGRRFTLPQLLRMARSRLVLTQAQLGEHIGVSRRTMIRWGRNQTQPAPFQIEAIANLLRANGDVELADSLLEVADLPIPAPPEPAPPPPEPAGPPPHLVDAVVFAASDAADLAPRKARLALRAALLRAKELGLSADAVVEAL